MNKVEIIANSKCWIEDNAKNQLFELITVIATFKPVLIFKG